MAAGPEGVPDAVDLIFDLASEHENPFWGKAERLAGRLRHEHVVNLPLG